MKNYSEEVVGDEEGAVSVAAPVDEDDVEYADASHAGGT
jgi:hypothetical protein